MLAALRTGLVAFGAFYVAVLALLILPYFQTHAVFLNAIRIPWKAQLDKPELYGLAPGKAANLYITTPDNVTLGAWFVLADPLYQQLDFPPTKDAASSNIAKAVQEYPTILFFHGNAATRAFRVRVQQYTAFTSRLKANVFAIDYRGFGDSEGKPSEDGLATDARAAWDWLISQGARAEDILIVGHSLGTAVSAALGAQLSTELIRPKGVTLMSPFSTLRGLVDNYYFFGTFPLMLPLTWVPGAADAYKRFLVHKFDTMGKISQIKVPILILHAENDWDVGFTHSEALFEALLEPFLPGVDAPLNAAMGSSWTLEEWNTHSKQILKRKVARDSLVKTETIDGFGTTETFDGSGERAVLLKTLAGSHDGVGLLEGVHEMMRRTFGMT